MPRPLRVQAQGIYHVTARGNRRQAIYRDDDDRRFFLALLDGAARRCSWRRLAYCLMTNHFHLVIDSPAGALSGGMHFLNGVYAQSFNEEHRVDGHLFEGRFRSRLVETESYLHQLYRYLAYNPVRAGLCERPSEWPWSSFRRLDGSWLIVDG